MPITSYECMFLLDSTKTASNMDGIKAQLHATLEKHGAQIIASRPWVDQPSNRTAGESRLSYAIEGHKRGQYYLTYFKAESTKMGEVERDFRLNEVILRHLVSYIEPKWADDMQAVALDETRSALQCMRDESPEALADNFSTDENGDMIDRTMSGPPRRPRRGSDGEMGKD